MIEKLIEHWLDSIGERGYQPAFCQMLIGQGHTIVHSTRHMSIEFGKDVISIDAEGSPCAFQLKGNPNGRLTLNQFREIRPQLTEMVEGVIVYPGLTSKRHKSYLVTNGEIDEEVHRAIDDFNRDLARREFPDESHLKLISRGQLLEWAINSAGNFWPDDFTIHERLIRMLSAEGQNPPDLQLFSFAFTKILHLGNEDSILGTAEFHRRIISAGIFCTLASRNYVRETNHNAIVGVWVSYIVSAICAADRHGVNISGFAQASIDHARSEIFATILSLFKEIEEQFDILINNSDAKPDYNKIFLQSGTIADRILWNARALKTLSLFSVLILEEEISGSQILADGQRIKIKELTINNYPKFEIWGEAAIPQFLAHGWCLRKSSAKVGPNFIPYHLLSAILRTVLKSKGNYIPTPYHSLEDCIVDKHKILFDDRTSNVEEETGKESSFLALGLFDCFMRANLKQYAKGLWPDLTRISHRAFVPANRWNFYCWRTSDGENTTEILEPTQKWEERQMISAHVDTPNISPGLRKDPLILLLFLIFYPHRSLPEVIRFLHWRICGTWFLPFEPIEEIN